MFDQLSQPPVPAEWQARSEWDGNTGTITSGPTTGTTPDFDALLREHGFNPELVEIVEPVRSSRWQKYDGDWLTAYRFQVRTRTEAPIDLPALYAAARRRTAKPLKPALSGRVTVPVLADVQAGKVGARGGTPELIDRLVEKREKLTAQLRTTKPESTVLAEAGDLFEGFESGGNPMFTNDLSLAQQMDLASTEIYEFVSLLARFGPVDVMAVPSNHTAWRNGKQSLGRPGDDLGLLCHRQVEKVANAAGLDATWHYPAMYDEAVTLNVKGTILGLVHGNQYAPNGGAMGWWKGQQHGGQPIGAADILIGGHYHHLQVTPTGRNPYTGRSKWFLQAPTLDNGSDWYRSKAGDDSDPGMLVFDVTDEGFDLQSLTVL